MKGIKVLSINSPSDQQVWPQFYQPLHAFTQVIPNSQVQIIPGLTHGLTPANFQSNRIDQRVVDHVLGFLSQ